MKSTSSFQSKTFVARLIVINLVCALTLLLPLYLSGEVSAQNQNASRLKQNTFLIGWVSYANQTSRWQRYADEGSNLVFSYGSGQYVDAATTGSIEAAQRAGLKLILDFHWHPWQWGDSYPVPMDRYEALARQNRDNQTVYGYYIADEPEMPWNDPQGGRIEAPSFFQPIYDAIKRGDPNAAITMAHANRMSSNYLHLQDILNVDCYPNWSWVGGSQAPFNQSVRGCYDGWLSGIEAARQNNKQGFIATGLGGGQANGNGLRDMTIPEYRWHVFTAVALGAKGFLFYDDRWADQTIYARVTQMIREVRAIGDEMFLGSTNTPEITVNQPASKIIYRYGVKNGRGILLAVNISNYRTSDAGERLQNVTFTLPAGTAAQQVAVLNQNRTLPVTNRTITDTFEPFAVNIYEISGAVTTNPAPTTPASPTSGAQLSGAAAPSQEPSPSQASASRQPTSQTSPPPSCELKRYGDANCDGIVNDMDYAIWLEEYLEAHRERATVRLADFDGVSTCRSNSGDVKYTCLADLEILRANQGRTAATTPTNGTSPLPTAQASATTAPTSPTTSAPPSTPTTQPTTSQSTPTPTTAPSSTPTVAPTPTRARAFDVGVGNLFSCALTTAGGVKCWGYNLDGQLGDGTTTDRLSPVDVSGLTSGIKAISVSYDHTCALTVAGGVKCWGNNRSGKLGDGTTEPRRTAPVDVVGLSNVASVYTSNLYSCALTTAGGVKCWGNNLDHQLGDGTTTDRAAPVDVVGLSSGVQAVSLGRMHACALTTAGGVKCWGDNQNGQLGDGTTTDRAAPVDVVGLSSGVQAVSVGTYRSCALMTTGGVKCWGKDAAGSIRTTPYDIIGISGTVGSISSGDYHTCGVTTQGRAMCWGSNDFGQLGDGSTNPRTGAVTVSGLASGVSRVVAKENYSCALTIIGGVKCWGSDTLWYHQAPYDIQRLSDGASGLSLGSPSSHSCASLAAGGVRCWGNNQRGQLGDGTTTDKRSTAVDVLGL